jgi:plastocyanin
LAAIILLLGSAGAELGAVTPAGTGSVEGTVQLAPSIHPIGPAHLMAESVYQHGATPGMDMPPDPPAAMVYAEPGDDSTRAALPAAIAAAPKAPEATVTQKDLRFIPSMLPILVGTTVSFPNEDDVYHNVFSYSPAKSFDLGRYGKGETAAKVTFDKTGVVKVFCEIHEHMRCTILVLDTPFFTTTDPAGHYQLPGLPPGNYTLTAWLSDKKIWTSPLQIQAGQTARSDLAGPPK